MEEIMIALSSEMASSGVASVDQATLFGMAWERASFEQRKVFLKKEFTNLCRALIPYYSTDEILSIIQDAVLTLRVEELQKRSGNYMT